jgi:hypothetical protein
MTNTGSSVGMNHWNINGKSVIRVMKGRLEPRPSYMASNKGIEKCKVMSRNERTARKEFSTQKRGVMVPGGSMRSLASGALKGLLAESITIASRAREFAGNTS